VANSLDSPHLAVDAQGRLYQTEPEEGRVVRRTPTGEVEGAWQLSGPELGNMKPVGVAVDADGAVWVTDVLGGRLLRITPGE
jgi:sugar lactone lactonase YvrE